MYYLRQIRHMVYRWKMPSHQQRNSNPIIMTGNQKSGTSAIAALLAKSVDEEATIDIFYRLGRYQYKLIDGLVSFEHFLKVSSKYWRSKIIKEPDFILFMKEIRSEFPSSPIVFIVRDPASNIRSLLNRFGMSAQQAKEFKIGQDQLNVPNNPLWNLMVDTSRTPYNGDSLIELLSNRWVYCVDSIASITAPVVTVRYEDFLTNKVLFIEDLASQLGIRTVVDIAPYVDKQYQPRGQKISSREFFDTEQLSLIESICGEKMKSLGYPVAGSES